MGTGPSEFKIPKGGFDLPLFSPVAKKTSTTSFHVMLWCGAQLSSFN